jgi:protein-tyrosine phosphatase
MTRHLAPPFHAFEGIHNFRDFGGYSAGGRKIAEGVLFRSGSHAQASDADLVKLADMGIVTVIDLRRPDERERNASRRWDGFTCALVENDDNFEGVESWDAFMRVWDMTGESFHAFQTRYYAEAPYLPRLLDLLARYFEALARSEGAVLVHCAAGKDRTGLAAALTHHLLGVHRDDVMADYLLTNESGRFERAVDGYIDMVEQRHGKRPPREAMKVAMSVHPDYLERSFAVMAERHGDLDGYLRDALGVTPAMRERIAVKLLG